MTSKKLLWVYEFDGDIPAAVDFICQYGNSHHADVDTDTEGRPYFPMVISHGEVPEESLPRGTFLVVKSDGNTYSYTKGEKEAALKVWEG